MNQIHKEYQQNQAIIRSIPIDKSLKRYYLRKFQLLCLHNGPKYASSIFAELKETVMRYVSDENRIVNRSDYLNQAPVRVNGWLRMLFEYADTMPFEVLDFLKLYTGFGEPLVTKEESQAAISKILTEAEKVDTSVPPILRDWLRLRKEAEEIYYANYRSVSKDAPKWFIKNFGTDDWALPLVGPTSNFAGRELSLETVATYWRSFIKSPLRDRMNEESLKIPTPDLYKDYNEEIKSSESFEKDYFLYREIYDQAICDPYALDQLVNDKFAREMLTPGMKHTSLSDKEILERFGTVGQVHHIPKKGTVKRRPIAVPNRFLQLALEPLARRLYAILERLPRDCTFNQSRFDSMIQRRINEGKYVGSVDLSQATDHLPFKWGEAIIDSFDRTELEEMSYGVFLDMLYGEWYNGICNVRWTVGQPLGSLPSFAILGLTHNFLVEAMSLAKGYTNHPYVILGDDIIFTSRKVRDMYISFMSKRNIPLSLHKSYDGRLCEFAGKLFIRNQRPRYISDHLFIHDEALFDYTRSTGIQVKFRNLHPKTKRDWIKLFTSEQDAMDAYHLIVTAFAPGSLAEVNRLHAPLIAFFRELEDLDLIERSNLHLTDSSVWAQIDGYVGSMANHGEERFLRVEDNWYKTKYRANSTLELARSAQRALGLGST